MKLGKPEAAPLELAPFMPWPQFRDYFAGEWRQGEHITAVGPTGVGKTTLMVELLPVRHYVCALATKPRDSTMDVLIKRDRWKKIPAWPPPPIIGNRPSHNVLWPPFRRPEDQANQAWQIDSALRNMFSEGGWTIFADELWYLCKVLGLAPLLEIIWSQGRSVGVTLVGGTQRPAWVPLMAYDQATHLFFWRDNDERNLARIASLGGLNSQTIRAMVAGLPRHEALYVNTRTGLLARTKVR